MGPDAKSVPGRIFRDATTTGDFDRYISMMFDREEMQNQNPIKDPVHFRG